MLSNTGTFSFQFKNCFCKYSFRFLVNTSYLFVGSGIASWSLINKTLGIILIKVFLLYSGNHVSLLKHSVLCANLIYFSPRAAPRGSSSWCLLWEFPVHIRESFFGLYFLYFFPCCSIYLFWATYWTN